MKVSIIIVNYNRFDLVLQCIQSLLPWIREEKYEIIVVDNGSKDFDERRLKTLSDRIEVVGLSHNIGYGRANNRGAEIACGEYLFLLNHDTIMHEDVLNPLVEFLDRHPNVGIVGPTLLNSDGSYQLSTGGEPGLFGEAKTRYWNRCIRSKNLRIRTSMERSLRRQRSLPWLTGAAMLVRRSLFELVGGFDGDYFMYFEDSDFCARIRSAGSEIVYLPGPSLIHLHGCSIDIIPGRMAYEYRRSQLLYYQKHRMLSARIILRIYLLVKYLGKYLIAKENREILGKIIALLLERNIMRHSYESGKAE